MFDQNVRLPRSLIKALEALKTSLDQHIEAIREQRQREYERGKPEPAEPLRAEVNLPPEISTYYRAEQHERQRKARWETIRRSIEFVGLLAAIAVGILTYRTLQQVKRQADSAQKQVAIMQRQLESTDRPWIKVLSAEPTSQYSIREESRDELHATINASVRIKNIGRSVADNISVRGILTFTIEYERLLQEQKTLCDPRNQAGVAIGILSGAWPPAALFPDDEGPIEIQTEATIHPGVIAPKFIGCVEYFGPGNAFRHYSYFMYGIETKRGKEPIFLLEPGDSIEPKNLAINPEPYGFSAQ